ncbi:Abi-alpha family protein [Mesorhizobium sp. 2RAF45]|uniref:Abi-alpha family protein n=1 Tax=Mesorhizobium sp. 2RAF45 TaxID=3233001 RepID=UPI003F955B52
MAKGGGTKIVLFESELEKEAAKVAGAVIGRAAGGVMDMVSDLFGGLIGDAIKEWRKRNLIALLARTADMLKSKGVALDKAKALPMGEAYAMFEEGSKQDDPLLKEMWAALLANAMDEQTGVTIDPAFVAVLRVISGVEAHVLMLIHSFKSARARVIKQVVSSSKWGPPMTIGMREDAQKLLQGDIEKFRVKTASIGPQGGLKSP